jgi:hypothetical protein
MPKTYRVFMTAFGRPGEIREVVIQDGENTAHTAILDDVYHSGQNDIQPQQHPSVSMGDIIEIKERDETFFYLVKACGFHKLSLAEAIDYLHTERRSRSFHLLVR